MKPKISIQKWDITRGIFPRDLSSFVLPFSTVGYQVICNGILIARSDDKNLARRIAYHLRTKWDK